MIDLQPPQAQAHNGSASASSFVREGDACGMIEGACAIVVNYCFLNVFSVCTALCRLDLDVCGWGATGIVPEDFPDSSIRGKAAIIEARHIASFLRQVESGTMEPVGVSGDDASVYKVGQTLTPEMKDDPFEYIRKNT